MKKQYGIVSLNPSHLNHEEFIQLLSESREAIATFNKANKQEGIYTKKLAELDSILAAYQTAAHRTKASKLTKELEEADALRDEAFTTLKTLVSAFSRVREPETKAAYEQLKGLLKPYKGLVNLNYEQETENILFLLKTFKEEANQTALNRLHLTAHVTALTNAQKAFDKVYKDRLAEQEAFVPEQAKKLRREAQEIYDILVDYTAIHSQLNPELVAYKKLHTSFNAIRTRYKAHQGSKKKVKAEDVADKPAQPAETSPEVNA